MMISTKTNSISTANLKRLLISNNLFVAGRVFFEIFLNIYIWKQTKSINTVAWFNILYYLTNSVIFSSFAGIVKKGNVHIPRKIGLIGFTLTSIVLVFLNERSIEYIIPIAILIGAFNGVYRISYQILRFDLTHSKNRGNYTGIEKALKTAVEIIMPVLGGFVITMNFFDLGYSNIFVLGTAMFLLSFFIGNVEFPASTASPLHLIKTLRILSKNKDIMKSMYGHFFGGFGRIGALTKLLLPLFIFNILQNEFKLGGWLSFFSVASVLFSIGIGRYLNYRRYRQLIALGGALFSISITSFIFFPALLTYVLFGIAKEIFNLFIHIPKRVISENLIHKIEDYPSNRVEYMVIRDWLTNGLGKTASFVLLLFATGLSSYQMKYILIIISAAIIIETLLVYSIKTDISKV